MTFATTRIFNHVWTAVSSHSSHHPQEVLLAQFSLHVHKGGQNPIHFVSQHAMELLLDTSSKRE